MNALTLQFPPSTQLSDDQFYDLCCANPDLRIERNQKGELILMPPTGGETGRRNASLNAQLWVWNQKTKLGELFDSSTGFRLPNGADRAPDAAWIRSECWNALTLAQREQFPPICPDFVIELRSASDRLQPLQAKMQEYIDNGARLGWLLNRKEQQVEIYRPDLPTELLQNPAMLSGESVLPGFKLKLEGIL